MGVLQELLEPLIDIQTTREKFSEVAFASPYPARGFRRHVCMRQASTAQPGYARKTCGSCRCYSADRPAIL